MISRFQKVVRWLTPILVVSVLLLPALPAEAVTLAHNYYYSTSNETVTIVGDPADRHNFQPVHTTCITEFNINIDGAARSYLAYDSDNPGTEIRLYYTNDLDGQWTEYSGNPILSDATQKFRWPSVVYEAGVFHMFLANLVTDKIERWTSTDAINFTYVETMTMTLSVFPNPWVWLNPNDNLWYLYWQKSSGGYPDRLYVRSSATIEGLESAIDVEVFNWSGTAPLRTAACNVMYRDGYYWLVWEDVNVSEWSVWTARSTSPDSGFVVSNNAPLLGEGFPVAGDGYACPIQLLSPDGSKAYLYTTRSNGGWFQRTFIIDTAMSTQEILTPNADGSEVTWQGGDGGGASWQKVDDPTYTPDDATTARWQTAVATNRDLFVLSNVSGLISDPIDSITVYTRLYDPSSGGVTFTTSINTTATTYDSAVRNFQYANRWQYYWTTYYTNPFTGNAWTVDEVNALQAGAKVIKSGAVDYAKNTQVFVEVRYARVNPTTQAATAISVDRGGVTQATLNGNIDSLGGDNTTVDVWFEYGTTASYGDNTTVSSVNTTGAFTGSIPPDLTPGATYHYRANSENVDGIIYGNDQTFTLTMPTVTTSIATNVNMSDGTQATLNGNVATMGAASDLYFYFEWGYDTSYGGVTPAQTAIGVSSLTADITGYDPTQTVHYRSVGSVGGVLTYGADQSFTVSGGAAIAQKLLYGIGLVVIASAVLVGVFLTFTAAGPVAGLVAAVIGLIAFMLVEIWLRSLW